MQKYNTKFICIGAIHVDYNMFLNQKYLINRTNPVTLKKTIGGVAYNISKYLRLYSNKIELRSLQTHKKIIKILKKKKIKFIPLTKKIYERFYTSVLNYNGKMIFGLANTSNYENFDTSIISFKTKNKVMILDLNFPKKIINNLITNNYKKNLIMVCGTSHLKVNKIKYLLNKIDVLTLNYKEMLNLTNKNNISSAIEMIRKKYNKLTIAITNGSKKIICIHKNIFYEASCPKIKVKNENGAGDTFSSIFFGEISKNSSIEEALRKAVAAGCLSSKGISLNKIKNYKIILNQFSKKVIVIKKM